MSTQSPSELRRRRGLDETTDSGDAQQGLTETFDSQEGQARPVEQQDQHGSLPSPSAPSISASIATVHTLAQPVSSGPQWSLPYVRALVTADSFLRVDPVGLGSAEAGSTLFDDSTLLVSKQVDQGTLTMKSVRFRFGNFLDSIQCEWKAAPFASDSTGSTTQPDAIEGVRHGGDGGCPARVFELADGEYLEGVEVKAGAWLDGVKLITNRRESEWFGGRGGSTKLLRAIPGYQIIGFYGKAYDHQVECKEGGWKLVTSLGLVLMPLGGSSRPDEEGVRVAGPSSSSSSPSSVMPAASSATSGASPPLPFDPTAQSSTPHDLQVQQQQELQQYYAQVYQQQYQHHYHQNLLAQQRERDQGAPPQQQQHPRAVNQQQAGGGGGGGGIVAFGMSLFSDLHFWIMVAFVLATWYMSVYGSFSFPTGDRRLV